MKLYDNTMHEDFDLEYSLKLVQEPMFEGPAVEAAVNKMFSHFGKKYTSLINTLGEIRLIKSDPISIRELKELEKQLELMEFSKYKRSLITLPPDFNGDIEQYLSYLNSTISSYCNMVTEVLDKYETALGDVINSNKVLGLSYTDELNVCISYRNEIVHELDEYTDNSGNESDMGTIDRAFPNKSSIMGAVKLLNNVSTATGTKNIGRLLDKVESIAGLLDVVNASLDTSSVSPAIVKKMVIHAYELNTIVSYVSVLANRENVARKTVEDLLVRIDKDFGRG